MVLAAMQYSFSKSVLLVQSAQLHGFARSGSDGRSGMGTDQDKTCFPMSPEVALIAAYVS